MNKNKVTITVELNDLSSEKKTGELASFFSGLATSLQTAGFTRTFTNEVKGYETMASADAVWQKRVEESEKALREAVPPDFNDEVKIGKFTYRRQMRSGKESFVKLGGARPAFMNKDAFWSKTKNRELKRTYLKYAKLPKAADKRRKKPVKNRRRKKRTPEELKKLQSLIIKHIDKGQGPTMEELSVEMGKSTADLTLPMKKLVEGGWVRASGHTRSTSYFRTRKKWS